MGDDCKVFFLIIKLIADLFSNKYNQGICFKELFFAIYEIDGGGTRGWENFFFQFSFVA